MLRLYIVNLARSAVRPMSNDLHILSYFDSSLFTNSLESVTKDEALKEMVEIVSRRHGVRDPRAPAGNAAAARVAWFDRDRQGSRHPARTKPGRDATCGSSSPSLRKGIDFDAVDGKPVKLFFLIVAPPQDKKNEYLPLLGGSPDWCRRRRSAIGSSRWRSSISCRPSLEEVLRS